MHRALVHRYAGPQSLAQALRWRRTVKWAYLTGPHRTGRFSDPYEQIIDSLVRQWVGHYRVWEVFTAPAEGQGVDTLELCHAWRMVRDAGGAWRLEERDFASGAWLVASRGEWDIGDFQVWPFSQVREASRAKQVREALIGMLVRQARACVRHRLGLEQPARAWPQDDPGGASATPVAAAPRVRPGDWAGKAVVRGQGRARPARKTLGAHDGEMVRRIRQRDWAGKARGLLRNTWLEPAMRLFMASVWRHAVSKPLASAMVAVYGFTGYRSGHLWAHLAKPARLLAWDARPNLRPLLARLPPAFWPTPDQTIALTHDCVDEAHRLAVLQAPAVLLGTVARVKGSRLAYWAMSKGARAKLEDLPVKDRQALVGWCVRAHDQHMPTDLMESLALAHRYHLLRQMDAGLSKSSTLAQAEERLAMLEAAAGRLVSWPRTAKGSSKRTFSLMPGNWASARGWEKALGVGHPWGAKALARKLGDRLPAAGRGKPGGPGRAGRGRL